MQKTKGFLRTGIGRTLLLWNVLALVAFAAIWLYATWLLPVEAPMRVTALDRAGIIDEGKLRETYPDLAENIRWNLGRWITEADRNTAVSAAAIGTVIAALNIMAIVTAHYTGRSYSDEMTSP